MKRALAFLSVFALFAIAFAFHANRVAAQEPSKAQGMGFPDLLAGLKATPGCLGVETAKTGSGKEVIFAWFKDKSAAMAWYGSPMHSEVMKKFFPGPRRAPLSMVKDDSGPILTIASITPSPNAKVGSLPISQIAIELYAPLPGGAAIGGRFAPNTVKVANMLQAASFGPGK